MQLLQTFLTGDFQNINCVTKLYFVGLLTAIKHALHNFIPDNLVGRDTEKNKISSFIEKHGTNKVSGSLYISGAPGTGKTACLAQILANTKVDFRMFTSSFPV